MKIPTHGALRFANSPLQSHAMEIFPKESTRRLRRDPRLFHFFRKAGDLWRNLLF
jgi:hypothetical protein